MRNSSTSFCPLKKENPKLHLSLYAMSSDLERASIHLEVGAPRLLVFHIANPIKHMLSLLICNGPVCFISLVQKTRSILYNVVNIISSNDIIDMLPLDLYFQSKANDGNAFCLSPYAVINEIHHRMP